MNISFAFLLFCISFACTYFAAEAQDGVPHPWIEKDDFYNIDEGSDGSYSSGAGAQPWDAIDDEEDGGMIVGSGDGWGMMTECEKQNKRLTSIASNGDRYGADYIPRCTADGEFEKTQCQASIGMCWCVYPNGDKIPNTEMRGQPDCNSRSQPPSNPVEEIPDEPEFVPEFEYAPTPSTARPSSTTTMATSSTTSASSQGDTGGNVASNPNPSKAGFFSQPFILAGVIGGAVVGLLCAVLIIMFIVYRMRKKDEGSYILEEKRPPYRYQPAPHKEYFA